MEICAALYISVAGFIFIPYLTTWDSTRSNFLVFRRCWSILALIPGCVAMDKAALPADLLIGAGIADLAMIWTHFRCGICPFGLCQTVGFQAKVRW